MDSPSPNHAAIIRSFLVLLPVVVACTPSPAPPASDPGPAEEAPTSPSDAPAPTPVPEASAPPEPPPPATDCAEWNAHTEAPVAFDLHDGWVGSDGSAVLVGDNSTFVHYTEGRWSTRPGPAAGWTGVWGAAADDVFAVGQQGKIAHYDGSSWSSQASGTSSELLDVWGAASDDVFAVGEGGTILHYDGKAWSPMASGTTRRLGAVWGSAPDEVLAAGASGALLHYDGARWKRRRFPAAEWISSLSGLSPTDVHATTAQHVYHFDGTRWSRVRAAPREDSFGTVEAIGPGDVYVLLRSIYGFDEDASSDFLHFDGRRWQTRETTEELLRGISASSSDHTYSFGAGGSIYRHDRSGTHAVLTAEPSYWRVSHSIGSERIAVSFLGTVWRHREGQWQELPATPDRDWRDAWVDGEGRVVAVGEVRGSRWSHAAIGVFEDGRWTTPWRGSPRRHSALLHALRPLGGGEYLAVGSHGLVVRGGSAGWTVEPSGTEAELTSLWISDPTDVHVVGKSADQRHGGVILHHDGEHWSRVPVRVDPLYQLWGTGPDELYAVGGFMTGFWEDDEDSRSVIMRFDGETWSETFVQPHEDGKFFERIAGNSSRDIFALRTLVYADGGEDYSSWSLYHYDGHAWTKHAAGDGWVGGLVTTPSEVTLATGPGNHRWACKRPGPSDGASQ